MTTSTTLSALTALATAVILLLLRIAGVDAIQNVIAEKVGAKRSGVVGICFSIAVYQLIKYAISRWWSTREKISIYGLQHGRLHLQVPTAMWMNMGYWKDATASKTMAEACRDLLSAVLAEAGFSSEIETAEVREGTRRTKCLIDLGFGCGDQTVYLMSTAPVRSCDEKLWDARSQCVRFDHYIGITKDPVQAAYASERVEELKSCGKMTSSGAQDEKPTIALFCADAAQPTSWNEQLQESIKSASKSSQERWVLALDTAYHFSPSRWPLVSHIQSQLDASFMAFDLCVSPTATLMQKLILRSLTALMGAPWANFATPQEYREKLIQAGYSDNMITITDISEHVFSPLAGYLEEQNKRLKTLGLSIGSFGVAKRMFGWWGRTGVVRGVIVVARKARSED